MVDDREDRLGTEEGAPVRGPGRRPRAAIAHEDRMAAERERLERDVTEDRDLSEDERLALFLDSHAQSVLPDIPVQPGYHVCWLTTTNKRDSIPWRLRLGYTLIKLEDIPGWEGLEAKHADFNGVVAINEMLAAKIPASLYNRYMRAMHHTLPLQEEEKLRARTEELQEEAQRRGSVLDVASGTADIVQRAAPMPEFRE